MRIDVGQFLRYNLSERIIEEERNIIRSLEMVDVSHRFSNAEVGLEGVSFSVNRGELVCVMGASGSGKSTLMKVLGGQLQPSQGEILLNDRPLYQNLDLLKGYISYIPQEDALTSTSPSARTCNSPRRSARLIFPGVTLRAVSRAS